MYDKNKKTTKTYFDTMGASKRLERLTMIALVDLILTPELFVESKILYYIYYYLLFFLLYVTVLSVFL